MAFWPTLPPNNVSLNVQLHSQPYELKECIDFKQSVALNLELFLFLKAF